MAGHSKWANIKRRKEVKDAKKAKIFTKLTKEIIMLTQQGGSDLVKNPRLRVAIQNAKAANIPKDNILRAIKKASGTLGENSYTRATYEGYGPYGVAILVEAMTDNIKRTVANVRALFRKYGGNLDKKGAIQHLFDYKGTFSILKAACKDWDALSLALIEEGLEDIEKMKSYTHLICSPKDFTKMQETLEKKNILPEEGHLTYIPHTTLTLAATEAVRVQKLVEGLEDLDDVQRVFHNLCLPS